LNILKRLDGASSWIRGKHVHVDEGGGYSGVTAGLDARGFLQVRTPQGIRTVLSGGVREDD
jgi:BirA family biotin operon repressor/biotin-[acetyl-CoA-carboxylase] ligase